MAVKRIDLSPERKAWQDAVYGEEVRGAGITSLQKTEDVINGTVDEVNQAAKGVQENTATANRAAEMANAAAANADNVRESTEELRQDLEAKRASDYWRGERGYTGATGSQGESGVMVPTSGMFSLYLDPATGDLYADYPTGETPPQFEYDAETGDLYYVTG